MTRSQALSRLAAKLNDSQVPYMVLGSFASSALGEPRTSFDLDIVIDPTARQLHRFIESLATDYYVDPATAQGAFERRAMFNIIDRRSGWKIDLIIRKDRPFSGVEFRRRHEVEHEGLRVPISTPEDTILSKLEWNKISPSERQVRDIVGVIAAHRAVLDRPYLARWALSLGVAADLARLLAEADRIADA